MAHLSDGRLFLSGRNLKTWTKYTGYNPDVNSAGQSANVVMGVDYYAYPLRAHVHARHHGELVSDMTHTISRIQNRFMRIRRILSIACGATLLGACNNVLDTSPYDRVPASQEIVDAATAQAALNGAYDAMQSSGVLWSRPRGPRRARGRQLHLVGHVSVPRRRVEQPHLRRQPRSRQHVDRALSADRSRQHRDPADDGAHQRSRRRRRRRSLVRPISFAR